MPGCRGTRGIGHTAQSRYVGWPAPHVVDGWRHSISHPHHAVDTITGQLVGAVAGAGPPHPHRDRQRSLSNLAIQASYATPCRPW